MELVNFLRARLDGDEAAAQKAVYDHGTAHWVTDDELVYPDPPQGNSYVAVGPWDGGIGPAAAHIARHDPARVLADVEAKRRIVDLHPEMLGLCQGCANETHPCRTVIALALPYADHPDFDEAWRV